VTGTAATTQGLELVVDDLSFPTSVTVAPDGGVFVAESGLPSGGAGPVAASGRSANEDSESCWPMTCAHRSTG
jgi:hypothetical protein